MAKQVTITFPIFGKQLCFGLDSEWLLVRAHKAFLHNSQFGYSEGYYIISLVIHRKWLHASCFTQCFSYPRPGCRESRALREANRGVIVEKFHPHDAEVRVLTIGGKAIVGATDSNWIMVRF